MSLEAMQLRYECLLPRCRTATAQSGMQHTVCLSLSLLACMEGKTYRAACQHMFSHATNCKANCSDWAVDHFAVARTSLGYSLQNLLAMTTHSRSAWSLHVA